MPNTIRRWNGSTWDVIYDETAHYAFSTVVAGGTSLVADAVQDILTVTSGTGITVSGTAGTDTMTITNAGVTSLAGTANQITASASTGSVTMSLPSAITLPGSLTISTGTNFLYGGITQVPSSQSATAPSTPVTGQQWMDTTANRLKIWTGSAWRIIGGVMPGWDLHASATVSVTTGVPTTAVWDTEDEDSDGFHAASADNITIPSGFGGIYAVEYLWANPADAANYARQAWVDKNTAASVVPTSDTGRRWANSSQDTQNTHVLSGSGLIQVAAGDVLRFKLFQSSGVTKTFGFASRRDLNGWRGRMVVHIP